MHLGKLLRVRGRLLVEQAVVVAQAMLQEAFAGKERMQARSSAGSLLAGRISSQTKRRPRRLSPKAHCKGTEKLPPPSRYLAANPLPRKIVVAMDQAFCSAGRTCKGDQCHSDETKGIR